MEPVESSAITAIGYDPAEKVLHVHFKNGSKYHYHGVSQHLYDGLKATTSKGGYFATHIRGAHAHKRTE